MIAVPAKVTARICPQMSQMFTDEEKHEAKSPHNTRTVQRGTARKSLTIRQSLDPIQER
jgi:hypothetical protein